MTYVKWAFFCKNVSHLFAVNSSNCAHQPSWYEFCFSTLQNLRISEPDCSKSQVLYLVIISFFDHSFSGDSLFLLKQKEYSQLILITDCLQWLSGKESACQCRRRSSVPGSGRFPGEGNDNPPQYSCLGNPMDRGDWRATVHGVARVGHHLVTKQQKQSWLLEKDHPQICALPLEKVGKGKKSHLFFFFPFQHFLEFIYSLKKDFIFYLLFYLFCLFLKWHITYWSLFLGRFKNYACVLSCFGSVRLFATLWTIQPIKFLCPWDSPGKNIENSLVDQSVKNLPAMKENQVQSLGQEDSLEKGMATHSSIIAQRIP